MTQVAGKDCSMCGKKILLAPEGSWCVKCRGVVHRCCQESNADCCPRCGEPWVAPEQFYVFSEKCPVCGVPGVQPRDEYCRVCGAGKWWENASELQAEKRRIHGAGVREVLWAVSGAVMAVLILLGLPEVWSAPWVGRLLGPLLAGMAAVLGWLVMRTATRGLQHLMFR